MRPEPHRPPISFFGAFGIEGSSPVPAYYQLEEHLRDRIEAGELVPGTRLPPEREVARELGISRMTVRHALTRLAQDGLLAARRGGGTFVAQPRLRREVHRLEGFGRDVGEGHVANARVLDVSVIEADVAVARRLELSPGPGNVIRLIRVRMVDGEPISIQTSFLPSELCRPLLDHDLATNSLYELLRDVCGLRLSEGDEALSVTLLDPWEAATLARPAASPAFLLERLTRDDRGRPVELVRSVLRGDRTVFHATLKSEEVGQ